MVGTTGAENIRWDLGELYASPTDPAIETLSLIHI